MKWIKALPVAAAALCMPGIGLRALHLLNGFDIGTGLPAVENPWVLYVSALFVCCAVVYAVLAAPLRKHRKTPFEQLLGSRSAGFRAAAVISGLLMAAGGMYYLYLTMTGVEEDAAMWARALEIAYAAVTVLTGGCVIALAKAQGDAMNEHSAALTLMPLLWSCLHLLVNYRMTCIDPKLSSFAFGLVADVLLVLAFYHLARMLYSKPRPAGLAFFSAVAVTVALSDLGGYGLVHLMGVQALDWSDKMVVRGCLSGAACVLLLAELAVLCAGGANRPAQPDAPAQSVE